MHERSNDIGIIILRLDGGQTYRFHGDHVKTVSANTTAFTCTQKNSDSYVNPVPRGNVTPT